jgi:DNA-binding NtrC family response regulator
MDLLTSYDWPGNVRELQNVIQRAVILCEGTRPVDETTTTAVEFDRAVESPLDVTASDVGWAGLNRCTPRASSPV